MMRRLLFLILLACPLQAHAIQVVTGSYTGNATDNTDITISPACQPVAVFIKRDTAANELYARFASMGANISKDVTGAATEVTTAIKALNANGFRLGTNASVNANTVTHYYVAICDNGAGDVSTDTWTGDGTDNRNITLSTSFTPELVIILRSSAAAQYWRGATSHSGDSAAELNVLDSNSPNAIQSFGSGQFQVGTLANTNTVSFYSLSLKASSGVATGSFTGNATDNRDITSIANPKFVLVKGDSLTREPAYRFGLSGDLSWGSSDASAANLIQVLQAGGFQVGTDSYVNENTVPMLWFALTDFSSSSFISRRRAQ